MTEASSTDLTWRTAVAANLLEARKKRGRIGSRKSRAGCMTCKARRIKCDEERPYCGKCSSSGRECKYAVATEAGSSSPRTDTSGGSGNGSTPLIGRQLSESMGLRENDMRTFDYFLSWTAPRLAGSLDKDFWCGKVLVLARSEPVILDALLAVSVLYEHPQFMKSFLTSGGDYASPDEHPTLSLTANGHVDIHHARALRYYNRSLRNLREKTASGNASPTLALLSCVIFIAIELIRDNVFAALALLNHGVRLARQFPNCPHGMDEGLWLSVKDMLARLGVLAAAYGHTEALTMLKSTDPASWDSEFADMAEARASLFSLLADSYVYLKDAVDIPKSLIADPEAGKGGTWQEEVQRPASGVFRVQYGQDQLGGLEDLAIEMQESFSLDSPAGNSSIFSDRQTHLRKRLAKWHTSFHQTPNGDEETACSLEMLYHIATVALSTWFAPHQTVYDQYRHHFEEIVRLAEIYQRHKQSQQPTFTFEVGGAIGPLYFVAIKCRVPSIRRAAIHLMSKGPKKESTFGAMSVGEFASRIVAIEEEGLFLPDPSAHVRSSAINDAVLPPEEKRIHEFELIINRTTEQFEIRVTRYASVGDGYRVKSVADYPI